MTEPERDRLLLAIARFLVDQCMVCEGEGESLDPFQNTEPCPSCTPIRQLIKRPSDKIPVT